jgi:hypothetical protein
MRRDDEAGQAPPLNSNGTGTERQCSNCREHHKNRDDDKKQSKDNERKEGWFQK